MLPDAGGIQESEVETLNRRNAARGRASVQPIYTKADAFASLQSFQPVEYDQWVEVLPDIRARYWNAGHLLGSASIELEFANQGEGGQPLRILASGDIGPDAKLLETSPEAPSGFDYIISESTYGERDRPAVTAQWCVVAVAFTIEPVSASKFPANREKSREFLKFRGGFTKPTSSRANDVGHFESNSLLSRAGNFSRRNWEFQP